MAFKISKKLSKSLSFKVSESISRQLPSLRPILHQILNTYLKIFSQICYTKKVASLLPIQKTKQLQLESHLKEERMRQTEKLFVDLGKR